MKLRGAWPLSTNLKWNDFGDQQEIFKISALGVDAQLLWLSRKMLLEQYHPHFVLSWRSAVGEDYVSGLPVMFMRFASTNGRTSC
jgi:hypothetical protein